MNFDPLIAFATLTAIGLPAVCLTIWLAVRIWRAVPTLYRLSPIKTVLSVAFILLCSSGVWLYLAGTALEVQIQLTCAGGECAQGGMVIVMLTPVAWISCIISWVAARIIFNGKILPKLPLQTDVVM
ncbi:MAG: hypothetical protein ABL923_11655 [Burkholderiaceae bacterium]